MENDKHKDTISIKAFKFNSISSLIITKLDTSSSGNSSNMAYKIDTGRKGILMPHNIFKTLFPPKKNVFH